MKKKLFTISAVLIVILAVWVLKNSNYYKKYECLSVNVDALSRSESGFGAMCSQTGSSGSYRMKLCNNCGGSFGLYAMDAVAFCR